MSSRVQRLRSGRVEVRTAIALISVLVITGCALFRPTLEPWVVADGQPVPDESIYWYYGPDHCEWGSAAFLHVGWPLGAHWLSAPPHRTYVRDPDGIFPSDLLLGSFDVDADLPPTAEDTGYRSRSVALWLDPSDEGVAYLVSPDGVERWPRFKEFLGCA